MDTAKSGDSRTGYLQPGGWWLSRKINDAYTFYFTIVSMVDLYVHPVLSMKY
jgi:hypothetical protein